MASVEGSRVIETFGQHDADALAHTHGVNCPHARTIGYNIPCYSHTLANPAGSALGNALADPVRHSLALGDPDGIADPDRHPHAFRHANASRPAQ